MPNEFTASEVADRFRCHPSTVTRAAAQYNDARFEEDWIGRRRGRMWFFTATDVRRLRKLIRDGRGRPRKGSK